MKPLVLFILVWLLPASITAQSNFDDLLEKTAEPEATEAPALPEKPPGPGGYRDIKLGMDIDRVKELLGEDPYFNYKGDPDVSFLPLTEEPLIECDGSSFIEKAYFQFSEKKLYIIILVLDPVKNDYYTLFTSLQKLYGKFSSLDPTEVVWNFDGVRLSLEKKLTVKYIDTVTFDMLKKSGQAEEDLNTLSKKQFLNEF